MTLQSIGTGRADTDVARLAPWFHNLHLPDGRQTAPDHPLGDFPRFKWEQIAQALPADLTGVRTLDIGCNAGYYAFAMAERGATVVGIDHDEHYLAQARWASGHFPFGDRVEFRRLGVYDLAGMDEQFDLILFMGVLYHLRHPLLALDLVSERLSPAGRVVFQTLTMPADGGVDADDLRLSERPRLLEPGWPAMAFIEHMMAGDPTNWWVPNAPACEAMLRSCGLRIVAQLGHEIWLCERDRPNEHLPEARAATGRQRSAPWS